MKRSAFVVGVLAASFAAAAVENKDIATCAAVDNVVDRLMCYDDLASKAGLAPTTKNTNDNESEKGGWETWTRVDPLNDKNIHLAKLKATSGANRFGEAVSLIVRCANNKTELYINWFDFLGMERISTTYRVDKESAKTSSWSVSTDKKAAFFPGSPVPLLKKIADSQSFVANVTPYNESPVTAVFDTAGANAALKDIRAACGW